MKFTNHIFVYAGVLGMFAGSSFAGEIDPSQAEWLPKYQKQLNAPDPAKQLLNTDEEPDLNEGFVNMLNGKDLSDWELRGGKSTFEYADGVVTGTCIPGEASTYLSTKRTDYRDFIFTCEMKWNEDLNSGVMFRAKGDPSNPKKAVFGPQVEMEGVKSNRGWSGAIYGQSCGGYYYPLWLKAHAEVRGALKKEGWNRVTVEARGHTVKTWLNGVPATHLVMDDTFAEGYFGLQVHHAKGGQVMWKNIKLKEFKKTASVPAGLNEYWAEIKRSVEEGDFKAYSKSFREDAVVVFGESSRVVAASQALANWEKNFKKAKSGELKVELDFRFSERLTNPASAYEAGVFRYAEIPSQGEPKVAFMSFAMLSKFDQGQWKTVMENQMQKASEESWNALK